MGERVAVLNEAGRELPLLLRATGSGGLRALSRRELRLVQYALQFLAAHADQEGEWIFPGIGRVMDEQEATDLLHALGLHSADLYPSVPEGS